MLKPSITNITKASAKKKSVLSKSKYLKNKTKHLKSGEVSHFAKAIGRQNGSKMVDFANEDDRSTRILRKVARVNMVNTVTYSLDPK